MIKVKKVFAAGIALVMALSLAVPAMAYNIDEDSKEVEGYGTLYGSQDSAGGYLTTVTQNPDRAVLTIQTIVQNSRGEQLLKYTDKSPAGATRLMGWWSSLPSDAYALWGAHGVQSGGTYEPGVVYTVTHVTT